MSAHDGVTVLVPTVGRTAGLRRLLVALAGQEAPGMPWQVLVVDNAATPGAAGLVEHVGRTTPLPVAVDVVHEPTPGAAHARTRGVAEVATPLVALLDDDVVPARDWLARLVAPFADPTVDGVGATVLLDPGADRPAWLDAWLEPYLTHLELGASRDLAGDDFLLTANAAFRTAALRDLGFDPALGPRPGIHLTNDDLDLTRRALAAGHRLVWQPDAVVVHDLPAERARVAWLLRRMAAQGRSDYLLDVDAYRRRRIRGLRVAWQDVVGAPRRWAGRTPGAAAYAVHLLADAAHAAGFVHQAAATWRADRADPARSRP